MTNNTTNAFGLTNRDMKTLLDTFAKYPEIKEVHLFGSRAKGNYKTGSDIDLAAMNEGVNTKIISVINSLLSESSLPYKVYFVNFFELTNQDFIDHIKRVGVPFYKRQ